MGETTNYIKLDKKSLFYYYYAFLDTRKYLADALFIKHKVTVHFQEEMSKPGSPIRIVFCKIRKKDEAEFVSALKELPDRFLIVGDCDYHAAMIDFAKKLTMPLV